METPPKFGRITFDLRHTTGAMHKLGGEPFWAPPHPVSGDSHVLCDPCLLRAL